MRARGAKAPTPGLPVPQGWSQCRVTSGRELTEATRTSTIGVQMPQSQPATLTAMRRLYGGRGEAQGAASICVAWPHQRVERQARMISKIIEIASSTSATTMTMVLVLAYGVL